jgi:sulfonate transport system substrate-binding protein
MFSRRACLSLLLCTGSHLACSRAKSTKPGVAHSAAPRPTAVLRFGFIGTGEAQPVGAEGWAYQHGELSSVLDQLGFGGVSFVRFANGPDLNEALSGGSLDVGIYGDTPALVGRAAGLPTRLVNQSVVGMDAWLLTRADGPRSLDELAGKTVATSKGSYMHRYLAGLLLEKGFKDKVKFAHLLPADAQAALDHGDIAAYAAPAQTAPLFVAKGARVLDRASDHSGLLGTSVTVVTDAFLAQHGDFPSVWNAARRRAVDELKQRSGEYYAYHSQTVRLPLDLVKAGYPLSLFEQEPLVQRGLELLEGTKQFLVSQALAQRDFSISEWAVPEVRLNP